MKVRVLWCSPFGDKHKPGDVIDHPRAIRLVECGVAAPLEPCGPLDESHRAEMFEKIQEAYHDDALQEETFEDD